MSRTFHDFISSFKKMLTRTDARRHEIYEPLSIRYTRAEILIKSLISDSGFHISILNATLLSFFIFLKRLPASRKPIYILIMLRIHVITARTNIGDCADAGWQPRRYGQRSTPICAKSAPHHLFAIAAATCRLYRTISGSRLSRADFAVTYAQLVSAHRENFDCEF